MQQILTKHDFYHELLEDLIKQNPVKPTTVLICSSRIEFFNQLSQQITHSQNQNQGEIPASQESADIDVLKQSTEVKKLQHVLLRPTLQVLAAAQHMNLIFCDSVSVLRAYLSAGSLVPETGSPGSGGRSDLYIIDVIALHHGTSEFTLQGLSRSLSTSVSAAHYRNVNLRLIECKDIQDATNPYKGSRLWDAEVPLLSGSIKIRQEGSRWSGRSITIRKIASRWFQFEAIGQNQEQKMNENEEDEEMLI